MSRLSDYPAEWPDVARAVKDAAGWRCIRCGHPHEVPGEPRVPCDALCDASRHTGGLNDGKQRMLTVHHLIDQKDCLEWWNLTALCQSCHLHIQGKVKMYRPWLFEHSEWFRPYVAGFYAWVLGLPHDRAFVDAHLQTLLDIGQRRAPLSALTTD